MCGRALRIRPFLPRTPTMSLWLRGFFCFHGRTPIQPSSQPGNSLILSVFLSHAQPLSVFSDSLSVSPPRSASLNLSQSLSLSLSTFSVSISFYRASRSLTKTGFFKTLHFAKDIPQKSPREGPPKASLFGAPKPCSFGSPKPLQNHRFLDLKINENLIKKSSHIIIIIVFILFIIICIIIFIFNILGCPPPT